ncbi:MAG: hypothetical protein ABIY52_17170 [Gemmatimonadaceae bacterium]
MSNTVIDYTLDSLSPANADASYPATVTGCAVSAGPGAIPAGTFPQALDFSAGGELSVALPRAKWNDVRFAVRVVFQVPTAVTTRQALVASSALPISLVVVPGSNGSAFHLVASVATTATGAGVASTQYLLTLQLGTWYTADLVYDTDTLALFVDDVVYSVHAFPNGAVGAAPGTDLVAGVATDGTSDAFKGSMAAIQVYDDIPLALETQLDERRSHPQWFLTYKQEEVKSLLSFGDAAGEFYYDLPSTSWIQEFPNGRIMYHDGNGQAFEMHGPILAAYRALPNRVLIGFPISDEIAGARSGSHKNLFSRGGIYWSRSTGAVPVLGQIWVDFESMGEANAIGLPVSAESPVSGGTEQVFQSARMYLRNGASKAFETHGAILSKYLATGGPAAWGVPLGNEEDLLNNGAPMGRVSEFERATIYWSSATGAFELNGDIRNSYRDAGGPAGKLGFPTSDEGDIPGAAGGRYNTFEHGSITWFGSATTTFVSMPFNVYLGRVDTDESEGWGKGSNDLYMHATFEDDGHVIHSERLPHSGDSDGQNIYDANTTFTFGGAGIIPNSPDRTIKFTLDVWESDWPDGDDHIGVFSYTLSMANAWGQRDSADLIFHSGAVDMINSVTWAVQPIVDEAMLTDSNKWWGVKNRKTPELTWNQYASAFSDVDSDTEWWDPTDWLAALFYKTVVKSLADTGNCFGMSLEAIYSKKHRSLMSLPIDRFTNWDTVVGEFNIKHQYQVGAPAIWWFVAEFLSGRTHNPVSVFLETEAWNACGSDPVICIAQNYDFSGGPHCILPVGWDRSVKPWRMLIRDPNVPSVAVNDPGPRELLVDPDNNTFHYVGASRTYDGAEWSGGRFHYMPYYLLNEEPRTPIFDALMLLLSGVILIVGDDCETTSLTDENGVELDAYGADAVSRLQAGQSLTNKFVSVKGFGQSRDVHMRDCPPLVRDPEQPPRVVVPPRRPRPKGVLRSEVHMRCEPKTLSSRTPPNRSNGTDWTRLTLKEYLCIWAPAKVRERFVRQEKFIAANQGRLMHNLLVEGAVQKIIGDAAVKPALGGTAKPGISPNFIHTVRGLRGGELSYGVKRGLTQFMLTAEAGTGEEHTFEVSELGNHMRSVTVKGSHDKQFQLVVHNRLGVGNDHLRMSVERVPLSAAGDLRINIKPGLGGIEMVSAGQRINAMVTFEYRRGRDSLKSSFALEATDGLRIVPSTFITNNRLKVSRITSLFGKSLSSEMVGPMP